MPTDSDLFSRGACTACRQRKKRGASTAAKCKTQIDDFSEQNKSFDPPVHSPYNIGFDYRGESAL
jgi:hypothetical protein